VNVYDLFSTHKFSNIRDFRWFLVNEGTLVLNPTVVNIWGFEVWRCGRHQIAACDGCQKVMLS